MTKARTIFGADGQWHEMPDPVDVEEGRVTLPTGNELITTGELPDDDPTTGPPTEDRLSPPPRPAPEPTPEDQS